LKLPQALLSPLQSPLKDHNLIQLNPIHILTPYFSKIIFYNILLSISRFCYRSFICISHIWGCIHKFPYWPPGARTANDTALCHWVQSYRYFTSQSNEFCHQNSLRCFETSIHYCCCCSFRYRLSPETCRYTLV